MTLTMEKNLIREQSLEEGLEKLSSLVNLLLQEDKIDEVKKVTTDVKYRNEMLKKYNLL